MICLEITVYTDIYQLALGVYALKSADFIELDKKMIL